MSAINYLTLLSTIVVTASGTPVPPGYINIASTNSAPTWSNSISTNGIQGSTIVVSSITTSTITVSTLGYSTISGSTINALNISLSTLTVSSINSGAPGVAAYSTFNASSINATSTMTTSTLTTTSNVGIGTASPVGNFHVYATSGPFINLGTAAYLSSLTMGIASGTGSFSSSAILNDVVIRATSTGSNMMLQTGSGASAIYINSSNNVGIGTANPGSKFVVYNSANSQFVVLNGEVDIVGSDVSGGSLCTFITSNNSGTSTYGNTTYGRLGRLAVNYNTAQGGTGQASFWRDWGIDKNGSLYFTTNQSTTQGITLTGTGSVGIGTSSPNASLQITNSSASGSGWGSLLVDSPSTGSAGGCITIRNSAGGANAFASLIFEIDGSTSCGVGTTPTSFAAGNGMLYCQNVGVGNNAGKLGFIQWNGSAEVETMTILPSGNVGVNNTAPKSLLSVLGGQIMVETGTAGNDAEYVSPTPGLHIRGNGSGTAQMILETRGIMTAGIACNSAGINIQAQSGSSVLLKYGVAYNGDYSGGSTGLQVNGSGVVLKPSQPYVFLGSGGTDNSIAYNYQGACFGYSGFSAYLTPYQSVGFTNTTGNGWVAGYGTFTAPWTGRYQVNITFYWNSFTGGNRWSLTTYNSAGAQLVSKYCCLEGNGFALDTTRPYGTTLYMSAGDYFQITLSSYVGGTCNAYFGGGTHSSMTIVFLG